MSDKIKAICVDDEESARTILAGLLQRFCPQIELLASYENLPDAVEGAKKLKPDVVFLDIEMPDYAGFEIVKFFEEIPFELIFVTAFDTYAVNAFEVAALDYLLKPIDIERLKLTVNRLEKRLNEQRTSSKQLELLTQTLETKKVSSIAIIEKSYRKMVKVDTIVAIEAQESYSKLYFSEGDHAIVSKNLRHFEKLLGDHPDFFRTHKSWIINKAYLKSYSRSREEIRMQTGLMAKLSRYRKSAFEEFL